MTRGSIVWSTGPTQVRSHLTVDLDEAVNQRLGYDPSTW